ncbi:MDR family MFS transporter [Pullulanibacillus sp. KACC 23026]|uniref:MDR family MFS transporter n=1 Tax=Pullulanibacillus sp. KACC 23026 TaxID=3028315 RepID=UPI0023B0AD3D|nr:MDR family MFS transporter [Pullulanibacillus sp. KACC 23026]WEG12573.1 MDR family MFS transporter [Pullulanibacillus sp. KACC 23026]
MPKETNRKMATVAMLVATFLVAIDVTVVSTAMPKIVADLSGLKLISWVFAIYTLTTSVTTPIYGKLADLFGRKIIFIIGVILFVLGSMLSGAAHTMAQLIWFRAFQGIGAGAVMPVTFTIIGDLFPGEQRARMQGVFSSIWGIAGLLGPLVGGFFVDHISWRWIFYINLPVGLVSLILITLFFHETLGERKSRKIDYFGAITFTIGISSLLYALLNGGSKYAWNSAPIYTLFAVAIIFIILFAILETKVTEPMLPPSLFKKPIILTSNLMVFLSSGVLIGVNVYLPMWIQTILGHSATSSGLTLMPMSIAWPLGATFAGRYMYKIGSKTTAVIGAVLIALGSTWLLALSLNSPYWYFVGIMIVIGLGMGYSTTPATVLVQSAVGWQMRGAATASNTFMRSVGQTVGVAVYGTIFNNTIVTYGEKVSGGKMSGESISGILNSNAAVSKLQPAVLEIIQKTLAHTLHNVFVLSFIIGLATLVVTLFLPSHAKVLEQQKQTKPSH